MQKRLISILSFLILALPGMSQSWIRINQLGYLPNSVKVAVFISTMPQKPEEFTIHDAITDKEVFRGKAVSFSGEDWGMQSAARLNFTELQDPGRILYFC